MPRHVKDSPITTPKLRAKLPVGLHWRGIDKGLHLGYRKGPSGGEWLVRYYKGGGKYGQEVIAIADDLQPADDDWIHDFHQAVKWAGAMAEQRRHEARMAQFGTDISVKQAVLAYVAKKEKENKRERPDILNRLTRHVLQNEALSERKVYTLGLEDLQEWVEGLDSGLKASAKERIATDFKAALNLAAKDPKNRLNADFRLAVKDGLKIEEIDDEVEVREGQLLTDSQVQAIIAAALVIDKNDKWDWEGDLHRMVIVLAATGARWSQAVRIRVGDVQMDNSRTMVPVSRKGRVKKANMLRGMSVTTSTLHALQPAIVGRPPNEPLLERWYYRQGPRHEGKPTYHRVNRGPWRSPSGFARTWKKIVKKSGISTLLGSETLVPYSLRHSSIVRHLKQRIPTSIVASLHDTSVAMIEKHYAAFIVDASDAMSAPAALSIDQVNATVTRLTPKAKR